MEPKQQRFDRIYIRDLFLRCVIGINPEERTKRQDVLINITLYSENYSKQKKFIKRPYCFVAKILQSVLYRGHPCLQTGRADKDVRGTLKNLCTRALS
jgi:hypothetical protein